MIEALIIIEGLIILLSIMKNNFPDWVIEKSLFSSIILTLFMTGGFLSICHVDALDYSCRLDFNFGYKTSIFYIPIWK